MTDKSVLLLVHDLLRMWDRLTEKLKENGITVGWKKQWRLALSIN